MVTSLTAMTSYGSGANGWGFSATSSSCCYCCVQASDDEQYSLSELKSDLSDCRARHVHVIVDQSYSGTLVKSLRRSVHHQHVAVYASGRDTEYSFADDFTAAWTQVNHTRVCVRDVFRVGQLPRAYI